MKVLQKIKQGVKVVGEKVINVVKIPMVKYKKGNHEGAMGGILAGLAFLGGSIASDFDSGFKSLLGNDSSYITDFLALIGFVALVGGIVEYRRFKKLYH
ncbi:MAG: conjugal transfer protein [Sulfolobus sp.]